MNCHQPTHRSFETAYVPKCHGLSLFIYIKRPQKFNLLGVGRGQCHPSASLLCIPFDVPPKALDLWQRAVPPQHPHWENQGFPSAQSPRHVEITWQKLRILSESLHVNEIGMQYDSIIFNHYQLWCDWWFNNVHYIIRLNQNAPIYASSTGSKHNSTEPFSRIFVQVQLDRYIYIYMQLYIIIYIYTNIHIYIYIHV